MKKWNKLDNAAKIFPATIEQSETRVFRFYCELKEDVQPEVLQQAVELAVKQVPQFLKILRSGLFWYYLESCNLRPIVKEESQVPCSHIYRNGHQDLLFNVTYYKKRINLEVFHALADGAGAIQFLKHILAAYINLLYPCTLPLDDPLLKNTVAVEDMDVDAFNTYYTGEKDPRKMEKSVVWRFHGKRRPDWDLNITEGVVSVSKVLDLAHHYKVTMTEFLVSLFIKSILIHMKEKDLKKTLVIDVPINLRNYFPSATTRNFFVMMPITYRPTSRDDTLEHICNCVASEFARIVTIENLEGRINSYGSFERIVPMRLVPRILKDPGLRFVNFITKRFITGCVSNLGRVTLPEELSCYVNQWGVYSSTLNIQVECISFEDNLTIGFTEAFYDVTVIYTFFHLLEDLGAKAQIHTNTPVTSRSTTYTPGLLHEEPFTTLRDQTLHYEADPTVARELDTEDVFPIPKESSGGLKKVLKWANILSVLAIIVYAIVYILSKREIDWIIVMCINTFFIWNSIVTGVLNKKSVLRRLFWSYAWTSALFFVVDLLTGWDQWSLMIQIPIFALVNLLLSFYLAQAFPTETTSSEITLYLSWECMMGVLPMVLTILSVIEFSLFPIVVGLLCVVLLLLLLKFRWRTIKQEYTKTFHI